MEAQDLTKEEKLEVWRTLLDNIRYIGKPYRGTTISGLCTLSWFLFHDNNNVRYNSYVHETIDPLLKTAASHSKDFLFKPAEVEPRRQWLLNKIKEIEEQ